MDMKTQLTLCVYQKVNIMTEDPATTFSQGPLSGSGSRSASPGPLLPALQMSDIPPGSLRDTVLTFQFHSSKTSPLHKLPLVLPFYLDM